MKKIINPENAPAALGPYSRAVQVQDMLYISGQIGVLAETGELVSDDFIAQAQQIFVNLKQILTAADGNLSSVIKFNVYVTDLNNFAQLNTVFSEYLVAPYPARAAVEVSALPKGACVEIEATAWLG